MDSLKDKKLEKLPGDVNALLLELGRREWGEFDRNRPRDAQFYCDYFDKNPPLLPACNQMQIFGLGQDYQQLVNLKQWL